MAEMKAYNCWWLPLSFVVQYCLIFNLEVQSGEIDKDILLKYNLSV